MGKTDEKLIVANETLTNGNIEESQELKMKEIVKTKPYIPPHCEVIKIESVYSLPKTGMDSNPR